jgi:hypothetical protein
MQRKAVAASIVSALIFSSLLLSAYTLNEAFRERFRFSEYSDMENKLYVQEEILSAATAFKLLGMEQEFLESNSLECNSSFALPIFPTSVSRDNLSLRGYIYPSSISYYGGNNLFGDFSGNKEGVTNFNVYYSFSSSAINGLVTMIKKDNYTLHLDFSIENARSICITSSSIFKKSILSVAKFCNQTLISIAASAASSEIGLLALLNGFTSSVHYIFVKKGSCGYLVYTIKIIQNEINGPYGQFTASVYHSEILELD